MSDIMFVESVFKKCTRNIHKHLEHPRVALMTPRHHLGGPESILVSSRFCHCPSHISFLGGRCFLKLRYKHWTDKSGKLIKFDAPLTKFQLILTESLRRKPIKPTQVQNNQKRLSKQIKALNKQIFVYLETFICLLRCLYLFI